MTLIVLRSTVQVFCRTSLKLGLCYVFLMIRLGQWVFGNTTWGCAHLITGVHNIQTAPLVMLTLITWLR